VWVGEGCLCQEGAGGVPEGCRSTCHQQQCRRQRLTDFVKLLADLGGDGQAWRHVDAALGHLTQVGALAAQLLVACVVVGGACSVGVGCCMHTGCALCRCVGSTHARTSSFMDLSPLEPPPLENV
jgi:hypothetical protein